MDASSITNLCRHLISSAIQRCRISGELCRLSVSLKSSPLAIPPLVRISNGVLSIATTISFSTFHTVDYLLADINCFFQKMLIMKIPKVGIELIVDKGTFTEHQCVNAIVANDCIDLPSEENNAWFKLGLVDYVLKHGNQKECVCYSCFPTRERLKTGSGVVCKSKKNTEITIEAVIIISELSELSHPSCSRVHGSKTEVIYFIDFSVGLISQPLLNALKSINWKKYGLSIKCISDEDGCAFIEWEDLPPGSHIDIAIHSIESTLDKNLAQKAVRLALNDLKEKNNGVLLSAHAVKIRSYAPDLAKTIAGLISTSNDSKFKAECASLLGLNSHDAISIEHNIKQKLISVIDRNDLKPQTKRMKEKEHLLFNDDCYEELEFSYEYYEDDDACTRESHASLDPDIQYPPQLSDPSSYHDYREPQTKKKKENENIFFNDDCFEEPELSYQNFHAHVSPMQASTHIPKNRPSDLTHPVTEGVHVK
ncbi:hypothetical protein QVD17_21235 [Tagetes erecta]|uniref:Type 2 DNA topoisomerase 6 subunit B-like n=1 Tax=Tagetes erecta TaxID=13708 RepID=A0AAD8KQM3_TARER|nr:hypothetical protein QVD17_21235 [Tagetes erecta]